MYARYRKSRQGNTGGDAPAATKVLWGHIRGISVHSKRRRAIESVSGWLVRTFTPEEIVAWWKAGWPPEEYRRARTAVKNHPRGSSMEDIIAGAKLVHGFGGG